MNYTLGKTNNWYYGTGEKIYNSASANSELEIGKYNGDGIYKSSDKGLTQKEKWTVINSLLTTRENGKLSAETAYMYAFRT